MRVTNFETLLDPVATIYVEVKWLNVDIFNYEAERQFGREYVFKTS